MKLVDNLFLQVIHVTVKNDYDDLSDHDQMYCDVYVEKVAKLDHDYDDDEDDRVYFFLRKKEIKIVCYTDSADACKKKQITEASDSLYAFLEHINRQKKNRKCHSFFSLFSFSVTYFRAQRLLSGYNLTRQTLSIKGEQFTFQ